MVSGQNKNNAKTTTAQKATIIEPKFDVSIPYDAAALLAFNEWKGDLKYDETVFNKFKILYVEKAVAEVIQKRVARELEEVSKKADDNLSNLLKEVNANFAFSEKKK